MIPGTVSVSRMSGAHGHLGIVSVSTATRLPTVAGLPAPGWVDGADRRRAQDADQETR